MLVSFVICHLRFDHMPIYQHNITAFFKSEYNGILCSRLVLILVFCGHNYYWSTFYPDSQHAGLSG